VPCLLSMELDCFFVMFTFRPLPQPQNSKFWGVL
jgi:hypothetical protein